MEQADNPSVESASPPVSEGNHRGRWHAVLGGMVLAGGYLVLGLRKAGRQTASMYRTIDPDVGRHIVQIPLMSYALWPSSSASGPAQSSVHSPGRSPGGATMVDDGAAFGGRPIVLVHGLGGSGREFRLLSLYLRWGGRKHFHPIRFRPDRGLESMAADLAAFIREVHESTGAPVVDVVAHSMGGVIARLAIRDHGLGRSVHTVVTLGTPHRGTWAARFAGTPATRNLRPDSALMQELNAAPWPAEVRGVSLWSRNDLMVIPGESGIVDGMESIEMTPFTHYSYLVDPRCWGTVGRVLSKRRPSASQALAAAV